MSNAPIQVVLNADSFRHDREKKTPASAGKDFFEGENDAFQMHQQKLHSQVRSAIDLLSNGGDRDRFGDIGFLKVNLRSSAMAKSHRPMGVLFRDHITPTVGVNRLGQMITQASSVTLAKVDEAIGKAELMVKRRLNKKTGELVPAPSRYRCEVGAVESLELWGREDRRKFNISTAIEWLADPRTGHGYVVELFSRVPQPSELDLLSGVERKLFESFSSGLRDLGSGLIAKVPEGLPKDTIVIEIVLTRDLRPPAIFFQGRSLRQRIDFDASIDRHRALIGFLENHPLVREIHLPRLIARSQSDIQGGTQPTPLTWPAPQNGLNYPKIGIIDGGISDIQSGWIIYRHGLLATEHKQLDHGSFIGGLVVAASSLNPTLGLEADGCMMADIDIFPDQSVKGAFEQYFPDGLSGFFDELSVAVATCRQQYGIRVFNLSLNVVSPVLLDKYSIEARRLDQIADDNDVIFVISAGNLAPGQMRPEWPNDKARAAMILATHRDDQLFVPAESVRNLSTAAINPVGLTNSIPGAPARYSRRGPGLRAGVKPDLCHIGGAGTVCPTAGHGLNSVAPNGANISGCGTSYAAPLVAKTLAAIEAQIEGAPSRETLIALAIHNAKPPEVLTDVAFSGIAHQLVGFGVPATSASALAGDDSEITLLFSSRIFDGKTLEFRFAWPPSLVLPGSKCRGNVRLTLVSSPHLDHRYGEEIVRANIEAALQQETDSGRYRSELEPTYVFFSDEEKASEENLIEHKFKWSPIKAFGANIPRGRGKSSNWRLVVNYLTRAGERLPENGIPFSVLLTIADPDRERPVFQEMRQSLQAFGIQTADIRVAARVAPRV